MGLMQEALQDWDLEQNGAFDESDDEPDDEDLGPDDDDDDRRPPGGGDGPSGPGDDPGPDDDEGDPWSGDFPPDMDGIEPPDEPIDQSDVSSSSSHPDSIPRNGRVVSGPTLYHVCPYAVFVPVQAPASSAPAVESSASSSDVPPPRRRVRRPTSLQVSTPASEQLEPMDSVVDGVAGSSTSSSDVPLPRRRQRSPAATTPGRDPPVIRVTQEGSSSRREVLRAPESPPLQSVLPPVDPAPLERMDEESMADLPPGDQADGHLEDGISMDRILSRVWTDYHDVLPSIRDASAGHVERDGELSYVRATYAWELAVLHRNLIVRLLLDELLAPEQRRAIEE